MPIPAIAVVTYKRPDYLERCLFQVLALTAQPYELLVVCDTDHDEETIAVCRKFGVSFIAAPNRGVVRNKNRALYHFMENTTCDPILILEDDCFPVQQGWLEQWCKAISLWEHVNFSHPALFQQKSPVRGNGSAESPHMHSLVTGQCTGVSRRAMSKGGYLDPRFQGYGHGHTEWTRRHARLVYADLVKDVPLDTTYISIRGGLYATDGPSFRNEMQVKRNQAVLQELSKQSPVYQPPYVDRNEHDELATEMGLLVTPPAVSNRGPYRATNLELIVLDDLDCDVPKARIYPKSVFFGRAGEGFIDKIAYHADGSLTLTGWAADRLGRSSIELEIVISGHAYRPLSMERVTRKDVVKAYPGVDEHCGFVAKLGPIHSVSIPSVSDISVQSREPKFWLNLPRAITSG